MPNSEILPNCPVCETGCSNFFQKSCYTIYICLQCEHGFVHPVPSEMELSSVYGSTYFSNQGTGEFGYTNYDEDKKPMESVFKRYLEALESKTPGRLIFDVGAATGFFLDRAKERGWKTVGSEISQFGYDTAIERGHDMWLGSLLRRPDGDQFDAITMWDVLEHVDDPRAYLRKVYSMLKPGGYLIINTINRTSLWARLWGSRWHLIVPPEHLNYFSKQSLENLLQQEGFTIISSGTVCKNFSIPYIFKTLASWQRIRFFNWCANMLSKTIMRHVAVPINLYDNILIQAKK